MSDSIAVKGAKPHPENYVFPPNAKGRWLEVEEIVEFKMLRQSGLLVKVKYDGGRTSTWLHSKDFKVHTKWAGGTAALARVWA
jgi:hypothetical protein